MRISVLRISVLFVAATPLVLGFVPSVKLMNAASPGSLMPSTGIGSGGYTGFGNNSAYGFYPECFNGCEDAQCSTPDSPGFSSCGLFVDAAMATWLQLGGRRLDNSNSYHNQLYVAKSMNFSGIKREEIFLTSKVGPYLPLGGAEATEQFDTFLSVTGVEYADLLLIHWPTCVVEGCESSTPACQWKEISYDEKECRLDTWRALVEIFRSGKARAIGVSNYNISHIQEIIDAGLPLPAVNQCPFNLWHSRDAQPDGLLPFMKNHSIIYNGYSPFGVPDRKTYPLPFPKTMLEVRSFYFLPPPTPNTKFHARLCNPPLPLFIPLYCIGSRPSCNFGCSQKDPCRDNFGVAMAAWNCGQPPLAKCCSHVGKFEFFRYNSHC